MSRGQGESSFAETFNFDFPNCTITHTGSTASVSCAGGGGGGTWGSITGTLSDQTDLQTALNAKEPTITAGTSLQYWRGDKTFQTLNTLAVPENTNLYYTDARVQAIAKSSTSAQELYVSKDAGNDAYDGSLLHPFKTIGAAVTAANVFSAYYKPAIIHVSPINNGGSAGGNYNENISLTQQGVNLICDQDGPYSRPCVVGGTLTVNLTGVSGGSNFQAASNETYVKGFVFASGASDTVTFSGSTYQKLIAANCYFQAGAAHAAVVTNTGTSSGTPSNFISYDTTFENNSASLETVTLTAGRFWLYGTTGTITNDNASGTSVLQNGASSMIANFVQFTGQYQLTNNTATATFNLSTIASGSNPCIVTPSSPNTGYALLAYFGCNSSATNSVTGSGVVANAPGNVRFSTSGDIIGTVTQASIGPGLPQGEVMIGPGAVTGTNVMLSIKDGHTKSANTTAPTASPNANAGTGATCTVTNASDTAGKINLTTTATSPASGVQCTVTFNKAFGVAPICVVTDANGNSVLFSVSNGTFFTTTTTTLVVNYSNSDVTGHANVWMYHCIETQ